MSIPYWRAAYYTDDGCEVYECLNCYTQWEARTSPLYSEWKFCPRCGVEWHGEKEWDEREKWDRKCGVNPGPHDRLSRPLFIVEKRFVTIDEGITNPSDKWEPVTNHSVCLLEAVCTLSYETERGVASLDDLCFGFYEYRVVFRPFEDSFFAPKEKPISKNQPLKWKQHLNGDIGKTILDLWSGYRKNMKKIRAKVDGACLKSA